MAKTYFYKAKNQEGRLLTGTLLADTEKAVARHIQGQGCFVLQIKEQGSASELIGEFLGKWHMVKGKDIAVVCRQLSTMMDAGVPLVTCLSIIIDQTNNARIKTALQNVYKKVKEGEAFSLALAEHPGVFPVMMVKMVEAGEIGGVLDEVLGRLATHFEKEQKLNEKIKSAMLYPAVVMVMAVLSIIVIVTFVLPVFMTMFENMKVELPWPTRLLAAVSNLVEAQWPLLLLLGIITGGGGKLALNHTVIRKVWEQVVLFIPVVGQLVHKVAVARFCRILSTLLRGGVPIILALDVVKKVVDNLNMMECITNSQQKLQEGVSLTAALAASQVFRPMVIQMVAVGEESGTVDKMLGKIADYYESEIDETVTRLGGIIEPVVVGILGIVIGFIVSAVVLPLFDIMANVGAAM
ncbi:MAG: epsF [Firmicutes bacterium]|nr:epsF [Bacillota bacterium]